MGFVKLKERGEVGHFVAVVTLYRYCRIDRIIRIKAGAATKPRTANCEVHLTGVFASGRSAAAYFPYPRLSQELYLSMLICGIQVNDYSYARFFIYFFIRME